MEVIVPDEFLSIAIGKKGQNVRLASKLTGWHLDVKSETKYNQAMQTGYDSLVALPGVGISLADALYESGFYSAEEIAKAGIDDLTQIRGIGEETAAKLLEAAELAAAETDEDASEDDTGDPGEAVAENDASEMAAEERATAEELSVETDAEDNPPVASDEEKTAESSAEENLTGSTAENPEVPLEEPSPSDQISDDRESKE